MNFSNRPMVEIENFISNKEANYFINFHKKNGVKIVEIKNNL